MMQAEPLAREEVLLSQNTLLVNLRFLDAALSQFALTPSPRPLPPTASGCITIPGTSFSATRSVIQRN